MWYVFGEDFVVGLVGPFATQGAAREHLEFQRRRGDAACSNGTACVVSMDDPSSGMEGERYSLSTPEQDRSL